MSEKRHHTRIDSRVDRNMERDVVAVASTSLLPDVEKVLEGRGISCALVRDGERAVGVISRTDLLKAARREAAGHGGPLAPLPSIAVGEIARRAPVTVAPEATVSQAAAKMLAERIHRVFVEQDGQIVGVFSTKNILHAIVSARVTTHVADLMSHPLFTIPADATIAHATDRLANAHVSGLTVVDDDGWPVGFFSQAEALAAREMPSDARVEDAMNHALVCLHDRAELHRAAALARAARARRVLVVADRKAIGVLSPLDFARAVS